MRSPFLNGVVSAHSGGPHNVGQYRIAEPFFEELDTLWTSKCIPCLSCQFFELGYVGIYIVIFELEFGDLCSGSVFSDSVKVLDFKLLKEEVP
jgi:hypothetical protein